MLNRNVHVWSSWYGTYIYIYIHNGSVIQYWRSCTPSRSVGLYFWGVPVPGLNATFFFLWFTNCVLLFDKSLIIGCLWPLVFVLNNTLILGIWCSTIPHLPGCFCQWTFFQNIGFNTVLTDPFMSHLATQLGYSAWEFQALTLWIICLIFCVLTYAIIYVLIHQIIFRFYLLKYYIFIQVLLY